MKALSKTTITRTSKIARKRTLAYAKEALEFAELNRDHVCVPRTLPAVLLTNARRRVVALVEATACASVREWLRATGRMQ